MHFAISALEKTLKVKIQEKIDLKTKPKGSLGDLESVALQVGIIQQTDTPELNNPTIVIFAGDHGITAEGVSPFPQEVTYQMVYNFLKGGAAINVFCRQNKINEIVVDAGVNHTFPEDTVLIDAKIGYGTTSFLHQPAMTLNEAKQAVEKGAEIVSTVFQKGCNVIGFGEMGIGNTTAASSLAHLLTGIDLETIVGAGTGLDSGGISRKAAVISQAILNNDIDSKDHWQVLATFGGYEIAMMVGAYLQAASLQMVILVDGFIASSALLVAQKVNPLVREYCIFTHLSQEKGHRAMCNFLKAKPLLQMSMRLGEGSGCALAYPLVKSAVNMLNQMSSFADAGVSNKPK